MFNLNDTKLNVKEYQTATTTELYFTTVSSTIFEKTTTPYEVVTTNDCDIVLVLRLLMFYGI